ncbi:PREDICTED: ankyrin repeat domain-containing protein 27-like [Nicrophorus vespilloides]|uniref:Ankyrin repeat domain-containing protein 27-like n=1 Tax=Nicrophorus vespilloides TaxID=110193 RepID=A0ABM1NIN7_NICVS|nr:PREDICTED: ankyrin repeat domain-containing protein 27-like [Nicrophorus vespilloides]
MTSYDEDIQQNVFHQYFIENHPDLLQKVLQENWILCVPRSQSITDPVTTQDIFDHVLISNSELGEIKTLSGATIHLENNQLDSVRVLFKESVYLKGYKYLVYCIEHPLNLRNSECDRTNLEIHTFKDCVDFLCRETTGGTEILTKLTEICERFLEANENILYYTLGELRISVRELYDDCVLVTFCMNNLKSRCLRDFSLRNKIKLSVESIMENSLNGNVFKAVCTTTSRADAEFNKTVRNLQGMQLKDFCRTSVKCMYAIGNARCILGKLNSHMTILGKISCLKNTFELFSNNSESNLTSEDLLQLFAFLIIKLNINNWIANLVYLQEFSVSANFNSETNFLITTLEAAIEFIKSRSIFEMSCNLEVDNDLLNMIRVGDLDGVAGIFDGRKMRGGHQLCHPLCACDECEAAFNLKDSKARNCLHLACIYGHPHIVEFLLHKNVVDINEIDYSNSKPIHYAASFGHQNALLLLMHNGGDIDSPNDDGDSPLLLAAENGHENCVKALLFYAELKNTPIDVNRRNSSGDTALHLASNWGFLGIVNTLLQYHIDATIKNKRNQIALDLAHNFYVKDILLNSQKYEKIEDAKIVREKNANTKNLDHFKKTDLLLKAIENNDLQLCCFYLGIANPLVQTTTVNYCHPLCNCESCTELTPETQTRKQLVNINSTNCDGLTALHVAARFGRKEILRILLDSRADVNMVTHKSRYTPLHLACHQQRSSIVLELIQCGSCKIDATDSRGNTPLHSACSKNDPKIVNLLITQGGADIRIKNSEGKTALQIAKDKNLLKVMETIQKHDHINSDLVYSFET